MSYKLTKNKKVANRFCVLEGIKSENALVDVGGVDVQTAAGIGPQRSTSQEDQR